MEIVNISSNPLNYTLCPTLYSLKLKSIQSPYKIVVMLQTETATIDITSWQDIRLQQPIVKFKVIIFKDPVQISYQTVNIKRMLNKVQLSNESSFTFESVQINKIKESSTSQLYKLTVVENQGYEKFKQFRKKVKKLQNITSSLDWKIGCRLRIVQNSDTHTIEIDDQKQTMINMDNGPIRIQLEELSWLSSPQDYMTTVISDNIVSVTESAQVIFKFSQYLTIKFKFQKLSVSSTLSKGLMSLRVLQSSINSPLKITISNPEVHTEIIHPLVSEQQSYFDCQYYYLKKNLEDTMSNSSRQSTQTSQFRVFQELRQLTQTFPSYPHLKNQILMPVNRESIMVLNCNEDRCTLQVFQIMDGLNSIRIGNGYIRFYVQFQQQHQSEQGKHLRMFKFKVTDIWNVPQTKPLSLKILNDKNIYSIDLKYTEKELKNLIYQNQFSKSHQVTVKEAAKTTIITKSNKYIFTEIPQKQYYVTQNYESQIVNFSLVSNNQILYTGGLQMKNFESQGTLIIPLERTCSEKNAYSFVQIQYNQIIKQCNSVKSLYKFAYNFVSRHHISYELIVKNCSTNKQFKKKIYNTKENHFQDTELAVISQAQECQIDLLIRRNYFDEIANEYIQLQLINKKLYVNCNTSVPDSLVRVSSNQFQVLKEVINDPQFGAVQLKLQITHLKQQLLDRQNYVYSMRIPKQFWQIIKESFKNINSITFQVLSSRKPKKSQMHARSKQVNYMDSSEFTLAQTDYRDSLAITINQSQTGYSKMYNLLNAKIQYPDQQIIFDTEGEWNLGLINIKETIIKFLYTFKQFHQNSDDNESVRTVSKGKSKKKNQSINLNKTMKIQNTIAIKQQINSIVQQNRMLVTKAVRLESTNTMLSQKIHQLQDIAKRQKQDLKFIQSNKNPNQAKNSAKYRSICGCGAKQNLYIGYCEQCIKQLQKTYGIVYKLFEQRASEYETIYFEKVLKKEKMQKLQNKVKSLKQKLLMKESNDKDETDTLQQSSHAQTVDRISTLKNQIFTLSLKTKNSIQSSSSLQQNLETKINQANKNIFEMMQQIQSYKSKMKDLNELIRQSKQE